MDKYASLHEFISDLRKSIGHSKNLTNLELGRIAQEYKLNAVLVSTPGHYMVYAGVLYNTETGEVEKHMAYDPFVGRLVEIFPDSRLLVFGKYVDLLAEQDPLNMGAYINAAAAGLPAETSAENFHKHLSAYNLANKLKNVEIRQKRNDCGLYALLISHLAEKF